MPFSVGFIGVGNMGNPMAADMGVNFFVKTFAVTMPDAVPLDARYQRRLHLKPCTDIYRAIFEPTCNIQGIGSGYQAGHPPGVPG